MEAVTLFVKTMANLSNMYKNCVLIPFHKKKLQGKSEWVDEWVGEWVWERKRERERERMIQPEILRVEKLSSK